MTRPHLDPCMPSHLDNEGVASMLRVPSDFGRLGGFTASIRRGRAEKLP